MSDSFDDEDHATFDSALGDRFPQMQGGYIPPRPAAWAPAFGRSAIRTKDVWRSSHASGQAPARCVGEDMLNALRCARGGIVYMKRNDFQQSYYLDGIQFYRFYLVPSSLIPSTESEFLSTEIGKGWVRQEALDLLGSSYTVTPSGHFSISRNLEFVSDLFPVSISRTLA
jgi:hypothetical protein